MSSRTLNYAVVDKIYKTEIFKLSKEIDAEQVIKNIKNIICKLPIDYLKDWLSVVNQLEDIKWSDSELILFFTQKEKIQKLIIVELMVKMFLEPLDKIKEENPELFNKCDCGCDPPTKDTSN
jgi:hypothetical protein